MLKKIVLLLSGNTVGSLMLLVRSLIIARLISVEDFGIASTLTVSMAVVGIVSGLGLQELIVQDKNGDDPAMQAGLHGFNFLRGLLAGLILFLLSHPLAIFLGIPEIAWAYQLIALIPVLRGLEHFDIHRLNRTMRFGPLILAQLIPSLLSLLSVWPLYLLFQDYRVMLCSLLLHWALVTISTHIVAERTFKMNFRTSIMKKGLRFGWPLLVNNILLFAVLQGDRLIVGRELGMEMLAFFSMGVTFTLTPTVISAATERQFFLPQLSHIRGNPVLFQKLALAVMQTSLLAGLLLVVVIAVFADPVVLFLLGSKYEGLSAFLPIFAIWQALRTFKVGNTVVALSLAQTSNAMVANAVRCLSLPVAWYIIIHGGNLIQILWLAAISELCAYLVSLFLVAKRMHLSIAPMIRPLAFAIATFCIIGASRESLSQMDFGKIIFYVTVCVMALCTIGSMSALIYYFKNRNMFLVTK